MKSKFILIATIVLFAAGCNQSQKNTTTSEPEAVQSDWYAVGEWKQGWEVDADETIDQQLLEKHYSMHPERWEKAFSLLRDSNLTELEAGSYELDGPDCVVHITDYITKNEEDAQFEAHRKNADIQYVVTGEEYIGITHLDSTTVVEPYTEDGDITFLETEKYNQRLATPEKFFVFFPTDAHRPSVKTGENEEVRKIVVKVKID